MDYSDYTRAQRPPYRDESPVIRDRFHRARSEDREYDSDGSVVPTRYARDRSPDYSNFAEGNNSEDESDVEYHPRIRRGFRNGPDHGPPSSYTEILENEKLALQQQLRNLQSQRQSIAPSAGIHPDIPAVETTFTSPRNVMAGPTARGNAGSDKTNAGPSLQVARLKKKHQTHGQPKVVKDHEAEEKQGMKDLSNKSVLTMTREFDVSKQYWRSCLDIFSPVLPLLLKGMEGFDGNLNLVDGVSQLMEPFMNVFHNRQALINAVDDERKWHAITDPDLLQARTHAKCILDFLRNDIGDISLKFDNLESDSPSDIITYAEIWMLYKPGTIVYSLENGEWEAFVVEGLRGMQKRQRSSHCSYSHTRLDLTCFSIDYDGEIFGRVWSQHCIYPFHGSKNISSLNLIPERFLPDANTIKASLLARGKTFWGLQGQQYQEYTGESYSQHTNEEPTRVIVDHLTYQRRNHWPIRINRKQGPSDMQEKNWKDNRFSRKPCRDDWDCSPRRLRCRSRTPPPPEEVNDWSPDNGVELKYPQPYQRYPIERPPVRTEDRYKLYDDISPNQTPDELTALLCPRQVHGFCLRDKVWKELNVKELRPVAFRKNAWDRLVLDAEYKTIIQAMVSSYVNKSARLDDLIASKGNGLALLLHGPPGSGKTLTAECVADAFSKPLYQVTCGDLGTDPDRLESRLEEIFDYAVTWGAILLLDEADIFLQDRDMKSLERNALVSIFLRTLDYFSGILFLTTNRVTTFDQAFQSRIHVTLGVPALDQTRRIQVWDIFVDDLAAKAAITPKRHTILKQLVRDQWSKQRLNGRQIRNAMRTALVLAEKKGTVLGGDDVAVVLRIGREFEGYLGQGKGVMGGLEGFEEVVEP